MRIRDNYFRVIQAVLAIVFARGCCRQNPMLNISGDGNVFVGYGSGQSRDNRTTPEESTLTAESKTVAALLQPGQLSQDGEEYILTESQLTWRQSLKEQYQLPPCDGFRFIDELVLPMLSCSAIAISSRVMLTSRHCTTSLGPKGQRLAFVYGFTIGGGALRAKEVHHAVNDLAHGDPRHLRDDWALIEVTPPIATDRIFNGDLVDVVEQTPAAAIGHPNYLGLLVSSGFIKPLDTTDTKLLIGDLDVAKGSSGGPVFDIAHKALVGIVYLGDPDNPPPTRPRANACIAPLFCEQGTAAYCRGSRIIAASMFRKAVEDARRTHP